MQDRGGTDATISTAAHEPRESVHVAFRESVQVKRSAILSALENEPFLRIHYGKIPGLDSAANRNSRCAGETADGYIFRLQCDRSWTGDLAGFVAVRHWVQDWAPFTNSTGLARSRTEAA